MGRLISPPFEVLHFLTQVARVFVICGDAQYCRLGYNKGHGVGLEELLEFDVKVVECDTSTCLKAHALQSIGEELGNPDPTYRVSQSYF
jgi:hypothetical protein